MENCHRLLFMICLMLKVCFWITIWGFLDFPSDFYDFSCLRVVF